MTTRRRRRHTPEQIVRKLRDADAMLNSGKELAAVLQALEVSESTFDRWKKQVKMPGEANVLCRRTARQQKERKTVMLAYCRQIAASSVSSDAREKLKWIAW